VLSWILKGVAQQAHLSASIVFKGGTVLKKIYFADYRFSEDLDFTLLNNEIPNSQIVEWFLETFEYVREEANIPLEIIDYMENEGGGINFYIRFIGPLGGQGINKSVKVDISSREILQFAPVIKPVFESYTDLDEYQLLCYSLEEVLVEKMRSVMQRMQARDFYDIWYLLEIHEMDAAFYTNEFKKKCASKNLNSSEFPDKLVERLPQYMARWKSTLREQIKDLPEFDRVVRAVLRQLKKIQF
jgi:predicted nucleotidyltransferase component of viral defense system